MTLGTAYINELTTPVMPYDLTNCDLRIRLLKANDPSLVAGIALQL
jgi:hypothetical protein